jgi:alginate O-acetyltransferase complex protein AlgI
MLFNSSAFLIFFPVVTAMFFALPARFRWFLLLAASCFFYMYFIPVYILVLVVTIVVDYIAGLLIEKEQGYKRRIFLILSITTNIGILAFFKYYNFFASNINDEWSTALPILHIILPIGLSFHTFQAMSYTIEVYRGNQKAERHFGIYALYVMFYPQLVAGPIERPQNLLHQFKERKYFTYDNAVAGCRLIMWGMIKKVVIADRLAQFTDPVFDQPASYTGMTVAIAAIFFAFQIFCDFSGYSDIALGTARVMGFTLMRNFNRPYHAQSISEFWKRWHISLSSWFRDYLYIPLGGNRVAVPRAYFNLFFVFVVSGFWHGANWTFIIWGCLHGFYSLFENISRRNRLILISNSRFKMNATFKKGLNILLVFILVTFAWIFFRANNLHDSFVLVSKLGSIPHEIWQLVRWRHNDLFHFPVPVWKLFLCLGLIVFLESIHYFQAKTNLIKVLYEKPPYVRWAPYFGGVWLLLILGVYDTKQFIYFQF